MNRPEHDPWLVGVEVALWRAGRVARRRAISARRRRRWRRFDRVLDVAARIQIRSRFALAAWQRGPGHRDEEWLVDVEVALRRAGRVARRRAAAMPRRRAEARLDAELDQTVRARILARTEPGPIVARTLGSPD